MRQLFALIELAEKRGIDTVFPALQLAAQTYDNQEMDQVRKACRKLQLHDTDALVSVRQRLLVATWF